MANGGQCLAGGMWRVVCARWWPAYGGQNYDVDRYHCLNNNFSVATVAMSHNASQS